MNCVNCGCSEESHPIDKRLTQHYGELTRGVCLACHNCSLYEEENLYEEDDCYD